MCRNIVIFSLSRRPFQVVPFKAPSWKSALVQSPSRVLSAWMRCIIFNCATPPAKSIRKWSRPTFLEVTGKVITSTICSPLQRTTTKELEGFRPAPPGNERRSRINRPGSCRFDRRKGPQQSRRSVTSPGQPRDAHRRSVASLHQGTTHVLPSARIAQSRARRKFLLARIAPSRHSARCRSLESLNEGRDKSCRSLGPAPSGAQRTSLSTRIAHQGPCKVATHSDHHAKSAAKSAESKS